MTLESFINFSDVNNYARKHWKYIQDLSDMFWQRWRKEYLRSLQRRQFCNQKKIFEKKCHGN